MHAARTEHFNSRREYRRQSTDPVARALVAARLRCPYCFWFLLGLGLMVSVPGLAHTETPVGALWLWLVLVPLASALLRRVLLR
ncbi:hypothetical protein [Ahniella affigens]|nr:hypothetical protein [Ahniella affigens]